jgi:iron complex outermembrane receptor protein
MMMEMDLLFRPRQGSTRRACCALVIGLVMLATMCPAAETVSDDDLLGLSLDQLMAIPVYTAAKRAQDASEAPSSVTVVTGQEVRLYGWRTLADLLQSVPGFYAINPRTYGFAGVRGFNRPGDFGGRLLLLVNGHRLNDPLYDTAAVVEDFILDLDLIDRVEIVRGPGSALYGNNAFFAVINVITKQAGDFDGFEATGEVGSLDTRRGRLTWGHRAQCGAELLVSASAFRSEGQNPLYLQEFVDAGAGDGLLRDGDDQTGRRLMVSHHHGGLSVEGFYAERTKHGPPAWGMPADVPRKTFDARSFLEGRYARALSPTTDLDARLYYDRYSYWGDYPYDMAEEGQPRDLLVNRDESLAQSVGGELQLNWRPDPRHTAVLGAEYRYDYRQSMRNYDLSTPPFSWLDIDPETHVVGFYAQDEYRPGERLGITAGVRLDHYDSFGDVVNPRLACVIGADDVTTIKLLYGRAFRAPSAYEFYYEDGGISGKVNPGLEPEEITTYEVVGERRLGADWRASVAGFANDVTNLIGELQDPEDGLYYSANLDRVKALGVELQAEGEPAADVFVRASFTYTHAEDDATGSRLVNSPAYLGKLNVSTPLAGAWLLAGLEAQYASERITSGGQALDDLWLVNATLYARRWREVASLSVSLYNLFDVDYRSPGVGALDAIEQDGRTLRGVLRVVF